MEDEVINTDNICHFNRIEGYEEDYDDGVGDGIIFNYPDSFVTWHFASPEERDKCFELLLAILGVESISPEDHPLQFLK